MSSKITTSSINVNYPVPGINNNSQGFRDNFAVIKNNINTAASEITDLQNKAILKSALDNGILDNNMNDTIISNAVTKSFRASTYNLGNSLSGIVRINIASGDVQYGTLAADTQLEFVNWADNGLQSNVELQLSVASSNTTLAFPTTVTIVNNYGVSLVENFKQAGNVPMITFPAGVTKMDFRLSTIDCGNNITIESYNRPKKSTQLQLLTTSPNGLEGDVPGTTGTCETIADFECTGTTVTTNEITCIDTANLELDMPITFKGTTFGNVVAGTVYYVRTIVSSSTFTISSAPGTISGPGPVVSLVTATGSMICNEVGYVYISTGTYDSVISTRVALSTDDSTDAVTLDSATDLTVNDPIVFSNSPLGSLVLSKVYYIAQIVNGTDIKIAAYRYAGKASQAIALTAGTSVNTIASSYTGSSIWKKIPLNMW